MQWLAQDVWRRLALTLGTGFGIGLAPVMPGTCGSLLGLGLAWLLEWLALSAWLKLAVLVPLFFAGIPICGRAAQAFGRRDPGAVVYDEVVAQALLFVWAPFSLVTAIIGFLAFRIFDIAKPWPVRRLERFHGGWGIMIDDVAAALYALVVLFLVPAGLVGR